MFIGRYLARFAEPRSGDDIFYVFKYFLNCCQIIFEYQALSITSDIIFFPNILQKRN